MTTSVDVAVVGAGAAGLFAALAARGALRPDGTAGPVPADAPTVLLLDGQERPGRKILISGGGRCNVTNATVTADDFLTEDPRLVRNALRAFGPDEARRFFTEAGVPLRVEPLGKVFPDGGNAHDVLDALLAAVREAGVRTRFGTPVRRLAPDPSTGGWQVDDVAARRVVLATGGRSVPATGSTGFGLDLAARLGHDLVAPVPALAPLHGRIGGAGLQGLTVPAVLAVEGPVRTHAAGSLLFTHKGATGPAALDVSHAFERGRRADAPTRVTADLWSLADPDGPFGDHLDDAKLPGCCLADPPRPAEPADVDAGLAADADANPRTTVAGWLATRLPRRLAEHLAGDLAEVPLGQLRREDRRALATRLARLDLGVDGTGGYAKAEVTAGGIRLAELDRTTLESRLAPGLHACGEVCDVTGRLGGFNFQWAWTSGFLAGRGAAAALRA